MSRRRRPLGLLPLLALALGACAARGEGSERLVVAAPRVHLAGLPLELEVATRGSLAERRVSILAAANSEVLGRFDTEAGVARVPIPRAALRGGANRFTLKTGSERKTVGIYVVPLAAWVPALLVLAGGGVLLLRRRRRRA